MKLNQATKIRKTPCSCEPCVPVLPSQARARTGHQGRCGLWWDSSNSTEDLAPDSVFPSGPGLDLAAISREKCRRSLVRPNPVELKLADNKSAASPLHLGRKTDTIGACDCIICSRLLSFFFACHFTRSYAWPGGHGGCEGGAQVDRG